MVKRGQAAMEFLMTYGWAILVVLAAIGALAYFGVLSPDNFLPEQCTVSPEFGNTCLEFQASFSEGDAGSAISLGLRNNVGQSIEEVNVTVSGEGWSCDPVTLPGSFSNGERLGSGDPAVVNLGVCEGSPTSGRLVGDIRIEYKPVDGAIDQVRTGRLQTRVVN